MMPSKLSSAKSISIIHFAQIDRRAELILAPPGAVEHGRAEVEVRR
jgi:hypothetical protein